MILSLILVLLFSVWIVCNVINIGYRHESTGGEARGFHEYLEPRFKVDLRRADAYPANE
jgi:hypothetical protein